MKRLRFLLSIIVSALLGASHSWAFPEMIRKGYSSCIHCHVSPTGGGVLNDHGREIIAPLLSWQASEGEARFAYGFFDLPKRLNLGGDIRIIQTRLSSPQVQETRFILMQADLETAVHYKRFTADATLGVDSHLFPVSRRHYLIYYMEKEWAIRAGRFMPAYGINTPDHTIVTQRGLGWDTGSETYNVETSWIDESLSLYGTLILGRPDSSDLNRESGASLSSSSYFHESYKIGLSYFYGSRNTSTRHVSGLFGILGFTPEFFLLSEWDLQMLAPKSMGATSRLGFVDYQKLDYEFLQGFHVYLSQQFRRLDFGSSQSAWEAYSLGSQIFPRPHFEIDLQWQKQRSFSGDQKFSDLIWMILHFYL